MRSATSTSSTTKGDRDPVQAQRADPFSLATMQRVDCLSRNNQYASTPGRGARSIADRAVRLARGLDDPGARDLRRDRRRARSSRKRCCSAGSTCARVIAFKLSLGILPARPHGHRDDDRRQSRPRPLSRAHRLHRGGRQGFVDASPPRNSCAGVSTPGANPSSGAVSFQPNQGRRRASINPPLLYEPPPALTRQCRAGLGRRERRGGRRRRSELGRRAMSGRASTTRAIRRSARSPSRCARAF